MSVRVRYQTLELRGLDLHVRTLRDRNQYELDDGTAEACGISSASWPLFGLVWDAGIVLADLMIDHDVDGLRVLEVGCGIGVASLVLNHRTADITATDHHPQASRFLQRNAALNGGPEITFVRTGWQDADTGIGKFDLIIGSDILYEPWHVEALASFVEQHADATCEVILIDPGRGHHARFTERMVRHHGYGYEQRPAHQVEAIAKPFRGQIMNYTRTEADAAAVE